MLKPIFEFNYWGLPIYLVMALIGLLFAFISLTNKQAKFNCTPLIKKRVRRSFWIGLIVALACANIANWFLFPETLQYPLAQKISLGGFSFYYGMLAFFGASAVLLLAHRLDFKFWLNQIVPSLLLFHAFGRVGCSLSGCCHGAEINLFGLTFDFPARELEALALFVLYFIFEKKIKERRLFWYLVCYSTLRFGLEFGRADDRGQMFVPWLSPAQVTSIIIWIALGIYLLVGFILKKTYKPKNENTAILEQTTAELSEPAPVPVTDEVPLQTPRKKIKWPVRLVKITALLLVVLIWWNPLNAYWCDSIKQSVAGFFDDFGKEKSAVSYDSQGNAIMDMNAGSCTAQVSFAPGEKRTVSVNQAADKKQTYSLNFSQPIGLTMQTIDGENVFFGVIDNISFMLPSTGADEQFILLLEALDEPEVEEEPPSATVDDVSFTSHGSPMIQTLSYTSKNVTVMPLASKNEVSETITGTVKSQPELQKSSAPGYIKSLLTKIETAYRTENAHTFIDMVAAGKDDNEFAANILILKGLLEVGKAANSCANSLGSASYDSLDKACIANAIFGNEKYISVDTKMKDTALSVSYQSHKNNDDGTIDISANAVLRDASDKEIERKLITLMVVKQSTIGDIPILGAIAEGYYIRDIDSEPLGIDFSSLYNRYKPEVIQNPKSEIVLGSSKYFEDLNKRVGNPVFHKDRKYIYQMMADVHSGDFIWDYRHEEYNEKWIIDFCLKFNERVISNYWMDEYLHYFRNDLNRLVYIPQTLDVLITQADRWVLINDIGTNCHVFGDEGKYNFKFVSKFNPKDTGIFEVVYAISEEYLKDKKPEEAGWASWTKCTEGFQPENMGSYNYAPFDVDFTELEVEDFITLAGWLRAQLELSRYVGFTEVNLRFLSDNHSHYDVYPWEKYGNIPKHKETSFGKPDPYSVYRRYNLRNLFNPKRKAFENDFNK